MIFLYDNAPSHTAKPVQDTLEALSWEVLPHAAYSPDLAPSDYHLFVSMAHALAEQRFGSYEDVKKWLDEWFAAKGEDFYWRGIHKLSKRWEKCVTSKKKRVLVQSSAGTENRSFIVFTMISTYI